MSTTRYTTKSQNLLENSGESTTMNGQTAMQSETLKAPYQSKHTISTTLMQLVTFQSQTLTEVQMRFTLRSDPDSPSWVDGKHLGTKVTHFQQSITFLTMSKIQTNLYSQHDFHISLKESLLRTSPSRLFFQKALQILESTSHSRWNKQLETCIDTLT